MTTANAPRVRRPSAYDALMAQMREDPTNPFPDYRDVLTFCAALGWQRKKRVAFDKTAEPVRLEAATNRFGTAELIDMLAIAAEPNDPEILADTRLGDRILIYEEYAAGGLEILAAEMKAKVGRPVDEVVLGLVQAALTPVADDEKLDLAALAAKAGD